MRVVQINSTCGIGSTGKIAVSISDLLSLNNIDNEILYLKGKYTEKNVQNKYYKHIETKYIPIDTENN